MCAGGCGGNKATPKKMVSGTPKQTVATRPSAYGTQPSPFGTPKIKFGGKPR